MNRAWWKESVVYQIYPRSFYDSNGDGIGDLVGIIQKLDYLKALGVDVIWLSPVYQSPNYDNGYDISDYQAIMAEFGSMADFDALLEQMHQRGIKLVMDLVINHTSAQHAWFVESRKSKDNPYRDFYIWRDGKDGHEPNNWRGHFAESAWTFDEQTGQYYLNTFSPYQPDLNWENPKLRAALCQMIEWWAKKGVDGFRLDAISFISKAPGFPDHAGTAPYIFDLKNMMHGPEYHGYLHELYREVFSKHDIFTVGECIDLTVESAIEVAAAERQELNMPFLFEHTDTVINHGLDLLRLKAIISRWQVGLHDKAWLGLGFNNHDLPRVVSMFGNDTRYRQESAKLFGTLLLSLEGTPFIYQGEEIGMTNVAFQSIDDYKDIAAHNLFRELVDEKGMDVQSALAFLQPKSRDNARTPMQWDDSLDAGFTTGTPWIQVNPNTATINVKQSLADPNSVFHYYQQMIDLRKANPTLVYGAYQLLLEDHPQIYAFSRSLDDERLLILLNVSESEALLMLPAPFANNNMELLIANYDVRPDEPINNVTLRPYEARVYRICA